MCISKCIPIIQKELENASVTETYHRNSTPYKVKFTSISARQQSRQELM